MQVRGVLLCCLASRIVIRSHWLQQLDLHLYIVLAYPLRCKRIRTSIVSFPLGCERTFVFCALVLVGEKITSLMLYHWSIIFFKAEFLRWQFSTTYLCVAPSRWCIACVTASHIPTNVLQKLNLYWTSSTENSQPMSFLRQWKSSFFFLLNNESPLLLSRYSWLMWIISFRSHKQIFWIFVYFYNPARKV